MEVTELSEGIPQAAQYEERYLQEHQLGRRAGLPLTTRHHHFGGGGGGAPWTPPPPSIGPNFLHAFG